MTMTDPIADLFTRLRNAGSARRNKVDMPYSGIKNAICEVLVREGFLREKQVAEVDGRKYLNAYIKTDDDGRPVIDVIERVSRPGRRVYKQARDVERVLRGMGIGVYSTSKGVLTDAQCREQRIGGEYLGRVW